MLLLGHARQRRARLALAARRQRQHLVARQAVERIGAEKRRYAVEIAAFARDRNDALHRATHHQHLPSGGQPRFRRRAQPRYIGSEGGDDDAALRFADKLMQGAGDVGLGRAFALAHDIGGIADHRQHALVAERAQTRLVGGRADARRQINLPIAGMDDEAGRGADGERRALGDRMGDGDELDLERPEFDPAADGDDLDRDFRCAGFAQPPRLGKPRREARHIDGDADARPKFGQRADVVLVRVSDDDA